MTTTPETLAPCPLCGAENGYTLSAGSTYRWWSVACAGCGEAITEARAKYPPETAPRTPAADEEWNDAGKYAAGLRAERDQLREVIADKNAALDLMRQGADQLRAEVEALRADAERWRHLRDDGSDGHGGLLMMVHAVTEGEHFPRITFEAADYDKAVDEARKG